MHFSAKAQQIPTLPSSEDSVDITLNTAVAENSVIGTSSNKCSGDAIAEISMESDARYSKPNLTCTSFPSVQQLCDEVHLDTSSQKASLADDTLSSFEHFQPYDFLKLPYEIRHMVYELVFGVDQQIHIKSNLHARDIPMSIIPCSDHSSTGCLQNPVRNTVDTTNSTKRPRMLSVTMLEGPSHPILHCQGTASFSHVLHTSSPPALHTMTICYDMQTGEQKVTASEISSCNQSAPFQGLANPSNVMNGLRLLRTCRQIYDEARLVLYNRNTFVFSDFATFAAYLGLAVPTDVYMPRLTYPDRLRAIHSMTKVELRGNISNSSIEGVQLSKASRLVRMGLGCLTSLTSFELKLGYLWEDWVGGWKIDDCLFSKPSSLKKLVVTVQNVDPKRLYEQAVDHPEFLTLQDKQSLAIAEDVLRRLMKREGFHDMEERLVDGGLLTEFWT